MSAGFEKFLQARLGHVADAGKARARSLAGQIARTAKEVAAGAAVALELDDVEAAEALVVARAQGLNGQDCGGLLSVAGGQAP